MTASGTVSQTTAINVANTLASWWNLDPKRIYVSTINPYYTNSFYLGFVYSPMPPSLATLNQWMYKLYNNNTAQNILGINNIYSSSDYDTPTPFPSAGNPSYTAGPYFWGGMVNCSAWNQTQFVQNVAWLTSVTPARVQIVSILSNVTTTPAGLCFVTFNFTDPTTASPQPTNQVNYNLYNYRNNRYYLESLPMTGINQQSLAYSSVSYVTPTTQWYLYVNSYNRDTFRNQLGYVLNISAARIVVLNENIYTSSYSYIYFTFTQFGAPWEPTKQVLDATMSVLSAYSLSSGDLNPLRTTANVVSSSIQTTGTNWYTPGPYYTPVPTNANTKLVSDTFARVFSARVLKQGYNAQAMAANVAWAVSQNPQVKVEVPATRVKVWPNPQQFPNWANYYKVQFEFQGSGPLSNGQLSGEFLQLTNNTLSAAGIYAYTSELSLLAKAKKNAAVIIIIIIVVIVVIVAAVMIAKSRSDGGSGYSDKDTPMTDYRAGGV